ncbi:MAG: membrane dipeptidase [Ketobacteraceae bacterium]|nr:membrane dipeptidase [Ketobacteraceae bacterium]
MIRSHRAKRWTLVFLALLLLAMGSPLVYLWAKGPAYGEKRYVSVAKADLPPVQASTARLHKQLFIADLHADPLLWARDLSEKSARGHVDVPRLLSGNVGLQVFGVVTQISPVHNHEENPDLDAMGVLAFAQRWPVKTWFSIPARGFYQAEKLRAVESASDGHFRIITSRQDLRALLAQKLRGDEVVGGLLAFEGLQVLDGKLALYEEFVKLGYRMMGLTHFFDTEAAGSRHGMEKYGLTEFGRQLVRRMEQDGVVLDLAHASDKATTEALAFARQPVVVSHTGVDGVCPRLRNLSDEHIRAVANTGGVVGIGYWPSAACGLSPQQIVKSIRYVADLVGVDHVALGSDYDGAVTVAFDTSGLAHLTQALVDDGFSPAEIEKIMGGNVVRVLLEVLPDVSH